MLNYHRFFKTDYSVKPLLLFIEATLMKKPDLGRYREAVYGCSSFITTFGFEESDRSQNEEDEFLAYRPNGLLICYNKKFLPLLWLSCDMDKWCSDSVKDESKYQSMYHSEKRELPSWTAILRGWTDLKVKHSDETFESLSQSVKDCLLMSETFLKLHPKGYHIFKEGSLEYCVRVVKVEVPILHACSATEGGNDLDANLFNRMPTWKEYASFFKNFLTGDFDNYDYTGHE
jgi:hypothetical protein